MTNLVGFTDALRGKPVSAQSEEGGEVVPDRQGAAYSFHVTQKGHNSSVYPIWVRPVKEGENVLYATVHQRFVYHLMFRLQKSHFARYVIHQAPSVSRMALPYTVLVLEADGGKLKGLGLYSGEVIVNAFPTDDLRRGAGVTVEQIETKPVMTWPDVRAGQPN